MADKACPARVILALAYAQITSVTDALPAVVFLLLASALLTAFYLWLKRIEGRSR